MSFDENLETKTPSGEQRKLDHIALCAAKDVESKDRTTGFENLNFIPKALPELDWNEIDSRCTFLGREFAAPLLITGMTGGIDRGREINLRLAKAAASANIPMGVGSQRIAIEDPLLAPIFSIKDSVPNLFLIANLGIGQFREDFNLASCRKAVDMIDADALAIHVNVMQELVQEGGDRDFSGMIARLGDIAGSLNVPLLVKEVGSGIDPETAKKLYDVGIRIIDVGGAGGTSWPFIEGLRTERQRSPATASASSGPAHLGEIFRDWGIPTAHALAAVRCTLPSDLKCIATGGIRDGHTLAKAIALGADLVGVGLPLFRAALQGEEEVKECIDRFIIELKTTMLGVGSSNLMGLAARLCHGSPLEGYVKDRVPSVES